jgi:hypothetical protein
MKKNLLELKLNFENALKDNDLEEFKNIKDKIGSIMVCFKTDFGFFLINI